MTSRTNWHVRFGASVADAVGMMADDEAEVVLCDGDHPCPTMWRELLEVFHVLAPAPQLIVSSRLVSAALWAEMLNLDAYDLLMKPFDAGEVFRVISSAWRPWKQRAGSRTAMRPPGSVRRLPGRTHLEERRRELAEAESEYRRAASEYRRLADQYVKLSRAATDLGIGHTASNALVQQAIQLQQEAHAKYAHALRRLPAPGD